MNDQLRQAYQKLLEYQNRTHAAEDKERKYRDRCHAAEGNANAAEAAQAQAKRHAEQVEEEVTCCYTLLHVVTRCYTL